MHKKVGEILIEQGLITAPQLSKALTSQLIFGGHLGTCFLELGMVDEDSLGEALAKSASTQYASGSTMMNIAPDVIKMLPRRMAERYRAVPLKQVAGRLHVAMVDPRNVHAIDDIAFSTGYDITVWIAPEVRILQALDKYYKIPRRSRYISLCHVLEIAVDRKISSLSDDSSPYSSGFEATTGKGRRTSEMEACCPVPNEGGEYGYGSTWREIAVELDLTGSGKAVDRRGAAPPGPPPVPEDSHRPTLWETTQRLTRVEDKEQAVAALLDFTATRMQRSLFLGVNDNVVSVWESRGSGFDRRKRSKASFDLATERIFDLMLGNDSYRGPLPPVPACLDFYKVLGMPFPKSEIMLLPVHVNDHLVAIFYGDGGDQGSILGETDEYLRLVRVFTSSVELLLLKERMQMVGGGTAGPDEAAQAPVSEGQADALIGTRGGPAKSGSSKRS